MSFNAQPLDLTVGTLLVGMTVTSTLFGILTAQTVYYFKQYPEDRYSLKLLVTSVWALDAIQQVFFMATIWGWIIQRKADDIDGHPLMMLAVLGMLIVTEQIQLIVNVGLVISADMSGQLTDECFLALTITLFVKSITIHTLGDLHTVSGIGIALNSVGAATDSFLSGALCFLLVRSRTGSAGTSRLINRLTLYHRELESILTPAGSICAITALAMLVSFPGSSLYVIFYFMGGRLYTISFLGTLNARADLRRRMNATGNLSNFAVPSRVSIRRPREETYANALRLDSPGPPVFRKPISEDGSSGGCDDELASRRDGKGKTVSHPAFNWEPNRQQRI
ncbi:hypothetical protein BN946_scf184945.g27 [Trametes cinnabarina]|uniref:DUF6534 domain-containing protein n=1 Tax=Pycnoporus cinnabarinus TaxID=5643 RepID=A0A060SKP7_PYCCI|nr:hypothetical protein BN946_scf184945.g27 [Trametes cinnabarina]